MRRDAQAVLLLLVGATLLKISIAGTYVRYVKAGQLPLLVIAGVVLVAVAGVTIWRSIAAPRKAAEEPPDENEPVHPAEPPRGRRRARRGWDDARDWNEPSTETELWRTGGPRPVHLGMVHADDDGFAGEASPAAISAPTMLVPQLQPQVPGQPRSSPISPAPAPADELPMPAEELSMADLAPPERSLFVPRGGGQLKPREPDADEQAAHRHDEPRIAWLLLIPALALLMFAPPAVGSYQASRNGTALGSQARSDFPPLPAGDPLPITMLDYAGRAVFDAGQSLNGRTVRLTGFIIPGPNGRPYLARMVVTCCAADARPVKIGLDGDVPAGLRQEQWVQVDGAYVDRQDRDPVNGETIPYLQVSAVREISAPEEQYE